MAGWKGRIGVSAAYLVTRKCAGKMSVDAGKSHFLDYISPTFVFVPDGVQDFLVILRFLNLAGVVANEIVRMYAEARASEEPGEEGPYLLELRSSLLYF